MDRLAFVLALLLASAVALAQPLPSEIAPPSFYEQATGFERDSKMQDAVRLYIQAARGGSGKAAFRLGEIYEKGLGGVPADYQQSLRWFNAARVLGYPPLIGDFPPRPR